MIMHEGHRSHEVIISKVKDDVWICMDVDVIGIKKTFPRIIPDIL